MLCAIALFGTQLMAVHLKVHGDVLERVSGEGLSMVTIKVYQNGTLQLSTTSNSKGKYELLFPNQGRFVVRFSYPGYASKSFMVDTRGPSWEGDNSKQSLYIGMTMVKRLLGFDLSLLEIPMGKAKFNPTTGYVRWDKLWKARIEPKYMALMEIYDRTLAEKQATQAQVSMVNRPTPRF